MKADKDSKTLDENLSSVWRRRVQRSRNLFESFSHALNGLEQAFVAERNLKIHLIIGSLAILAALLLSFDSFSWAVLFMAIGLVITAELLNTAVERVVDLVSGGQFHILAKEAKDIAAAAVFVASLTAVCIGVALFVPKLLLLVGP
ncbi:MAG: diacylglycerol kinase family protein [Candidatus Obscuribacterales bacterium]|nr:diacylglycerol kinase family protein [Candidatus Obscuribacterales bacterium]